MIALVYPGRRRLDNAIAPSVPSAGAVVVASVLAGLALGRGNLAGTALAAAAGAVLAGMALIAPKRAILGLLVWLSVLGLLRRLLPSSSSVLGGDPLLLVAPVVLGVLGSLAIRSGALRQRSRLTNAILLLMGAFALSALNPLQGGPAVGLGGLLLTVVPMTAFLVGRRFVDDELLVSLAGLIVLAATAAAMYGLYQTFVGLPAWDQRWLETSFYTALSVRGITRAFSTFTAASEYAAFLGVGIVALVSLARTGRWLVAAAPVGILLLIALWFEASRGILVFTLGAVAMLVCARLGVRLRGAVLLVVAVLAFLPFVVSRLAPVSDGATTASELAFHQSSGLSDPFGEGSTLPGHVDLVRQGLVDAFRNPLGRGAGSINTSAGKFGGVAKGAEADPGNAGIAAGVVGLLAYGASAVYGLSALYRRARNRRDTAALLALGISLVTLFQWLNGGQYAVAFLPWLALGWVDSPSRRAGSLEPA